MRARLAVQTKGLGILDVLVDEAFDGRPGAGERRGTHLRLRLRLVILAKKVSNAFSHEQGEVRPEQAHRVGMG
jgi:hypothetical protein